MDIHSIPNKFGPNGCQLDITLHIFGQFNISFSYNISGYQFWQHDNHPIEVFTPTVIAQKLD